MDKREEEAAELMRDFRIERGEIEPEEICEHKSWDDVYDAEDPDYLYCAVCGETWRKKKKASK